jgi:hypothetical protein
MLMLLRRTWLLLRRVLMRRGLYRPGRLYGARLLHRMRHGRMWLLHGSLWLGLRRMLLGYGTLLRLLHRAGLRRLRSVLVRLWLCRMRLQDRMWLGL